MKKLLSLFLTSLFILSLTLIPAYAEEVNYDAFTLENLVSKSKARFDQDDYSYSYSKFTVNGPTTLKINSTRKNIASVGVYKVQLEDLKHPSKYLYYSEPRTPIKWDDITYTVTLYDDNQNITGTKEFKELPGEEYFEQYEITSGHINLSDSGFYLVDVSEWAAASDIFIIEVLSDGVKAVDVPYTIEGLENFQSQRTYNNIFKDISQEAWYKNDVINCFEIGLIEGKAEGKFDPIGNVSIAEALTIASRINKIYAGNGRIIENTGSNWYDGAVSYAKENTIIYGDEFKNYTKAATRAELAYIFANTLNYEEYKEINNVLEIPDVDYDTSYNNEIFKLYNAGIVTGSDANLTFKPESNITRAEVAAIINRIINTTNRKKI